MVIQQGRKRPDDSRWAHLGFRITPRLQLGEIGQRDHFIPFLERDRLGRFLDDMWRENATEGRSRSRKGVKYLAFAIHRAEAAVLGPAQKLRCAPGKSALTFELCDSSRAVQNSFECANDGSS